MAADLAQHDERMRLLPPLALASKSELQCSPEPAIPLALHRANGPSKDPADTLLPRSILLHVCLPILALEFSLWVANATLVSSTPLYLRKHLGIDSVRATEISYTLQSLTNLVPIAGGYVADQHFGRFNTIVGACVIFTAGMVLCTIATHPSVASVELLMIGLFGGTAIAQGGTAPCLVVLGADQFNTAIPAQRVEKDSFFNWFYWAINIGSFLSCAFLANLAVDGFAPFVSEKMGFFSAFGIATLVFFSCSVMFYRGKDRYIRHPPKGSVLTEFSSVLLRACITSRRGLLVLSGGVAFIPGIVLTTASYYVDETKPLHMILALSGAGSVVYGAVVLTVTCHSVDWVKLASRARGGQLDDDQVRDVGQVLRLMPYLTIIIVFWATYSQMETNFLLQGCQMDLRVSGGGMISSATLVTFDTGVILLFIPVFDRLVYPKLASMGVFPTTLRKIGAGMVFSLASMLCAAWLETRRKQSDVVAGMGSNCAEDDGSGAALPMATMSVWWQILQYVLMGISEILTSITSYDLFYSEVPESMRSACQSLNLLTTTLGYIVAGALNSIFSFWVTTDLNDGHLEYIFLIMATLIALSLAVFVCISRSFEYASSSAPSPSTVAYEPNFTIAA